MAEITFHANINGNTNTSDSTLIPHELGSGIGFYGTNGFGISVPVGSQQGTTWVTNGVGTEKAAQLNNTAMADVGDENSPGTVSINGGGSVNLNNLPNYLCPLNIRFTHTEAVKVQNCKLRIFDRSDIDNHADGVTTYVYEARHPAHSQDINQLSFRGRPENYWEVFDPDLIMTDMPFTASPGMSGLNSNSSDTNSSLGYSTRDGVTHTSTRHDWYVALSSEPNSVGSKTSYGLYFTVEYL